MNENYLYAAYLLFWLGPLVYLLKLGSRVKKLESQPGRAK